MSQSPATPHPALTTLLVGRDHTAEPVAQVRDSRQHQTVAGIVARDDFDFACMNPFTEEVGGYTGVFNFIYYTKDGTLNVSRIGKTGRVLRQFPAPVDDES